MQSVGVRRHRASKTVKELILSAKKSRTAANAAMIYRKNPCQPEQIKGDISHRYDLSKTRHPNHPLGPNVSIRTRSASPVKDSFERRIRYVRSCINITDQENAPVSKKANIETITEEVVEETKKSV